MNASDLRDWRAALGLTVTAAAEVLGCGRRSLQNWEAGRHPVPKYIGMACHWHLWTAQR